jgi:hypothetical protein
MYTMEHFFLAVLHGFIGILQNVGRTVVMTYYKLNGVFLLVLIFPAASTVLALYVIG